LQVITKTICRIMITVLLGFSVASPGIAQEKIRNNYASPSKKAHPLPATRWVAVGYSDLLDKNKIIRTGQPLRSALSDPALRGAVQPFVDRYSYLLPYAVEMLNGPNPSYHKDITADYPIGTSQPAWVAIVREGTIVVMTDHSGSAQVFLPAESAHSAYVQHYPVIRHALSTLLPTDGSALAVEVYAYKHSYRNSEFQLNPQPYRFRSASFPRPAGTIPLDLAGLETFFTRGGQLECAEISRQKGLILYAKEASKQTLSGQKIALSDFAVAYRAVFHAGDNQAFISLDPHKDITKTTVNFGGLLEDTRIGSVVLEADKRFKTISSGIDPTTYQDMRQYTRRFVPGFLSVSEREFVTDYEDNSSNWIKTRFWFYPDSIDMITDAANHFVKINSPQFTADAERSSDDFSSNAEYQRKKKQALLPSIRKNIDHLNQHYAEYAKAYQDINELSNVGRLMGICSWLSKAKAPWLDLAELLSVELPPCQTERERTQMITVSYLATNNAVIKEETVNEKVKVSFLSPLLDQPVKACFGNQDNLAEFLARKSNKPATTMDFYKKESRKLFNAPITARELISSKHDLEMFAVYNAGRIDKGPVYIADKEIIEKEKKTLDTIFATLNTIKKQIDSPDVTSKNLLIEKYKDLVNLYNSKGEALTKKIENYNALVGNSRHKLFVEISGGINLEPKYFAIKKSTDANEFRHLKHVKDNNWTQFANSGKWIRSRVDSPRGPRAQTPPQKKQSAFDSIPGLSFLRSLRNEKPIASKNKPQDNYSITRNAQTQSWSDSYSEQASVSRTRSFDGTRKTLKITDYHNGKVASEIKGEMVNNNKIVFTKIPDKDN